ncbi:hypothetical protein ABZV93_08005 [Actinopolymorpha sp. NPDC004070]|uniref:NACHT domain-containing protein n=1 Tax=Actinopolymorpha sp. NPDC004070 TaxID=3154548 RepID=UPI00339F26CD
MPDYRLEGLAPRTFEHLVQALAVGAISSTITPFGDGPDGGREASFDGPTHYGAAGATWSGYGVIQAKFRSRTRDVASDGRWALDHLRRELNSFEKENSSRRIPEYFIYATNVVLTPGVDGSKDQVLDRLSKFATRHNLKGFDVWDYDKLRILIDNNADVRRANAAWITSGDVLSQLAEHLSSQRPDYYGLIIKYLQRELLADQYAKLEQAGHTADEAIPLAQVFVDLPTGRTPASDMEVPDRQERTRRFVATVIQEARYRFGREAFSNPQDRGSEERREPKGRYVLIGGPGQGKTTIGQFVCQAFRAAILRDIPRHMLSTDAAHAADGISSQWVTGATLPEPKARRLPFRIVLSEFAASLASGEVQSVLGYIAARFSARTDRTVLAEDIESIMKEYPTLLVLDGLDEVPPSTNRDGIMEAISNFAIEVAVSNIDIMLVATSRPQGYNEEFSAMQYDHHYLQPLSADAAIDYGSRLAAVRFGEDRDRREKVCGRLRKAAGQPSTARLMRSPLQVTILTLLVDRIGHPPEERWALFREYYKIIYQRETEREIPSVKVLKANREDVDAIHTRVGLLLQVESERSGGTDARLSVEQFGMLVEDYLREEGYEGATVDELKKQIIEAAANRLVFLVGLEQGEVGFEIRSLQEFMAAEGLMDGGDEIIQERLREVAPSSNWRNVFLFAAGKCFAERRHLRDTIESICVEMNDNVNDRTCRELLIGSELALDLLEDGPARRQPSKRRALTRLSLRLLDHPASGVAERLAAVYSSETADVFIEELQKRLRTEEDHESMSQTLSWEVFAHLVEKYGQELSEFSARYLRHTPMKPHVFSVLIATAMGRNSELATRLLEEVPKQSVMDLRFSRRRVANSGSLVTHVPWKPSDLPPWLRWYLRLTDTLDDPGSHNYVPVRLRARARSIGTVPIRSVFRRSRRSELSDESRVPFADASPSWRWLALVEEFGARPTAELLADLIRQLQDSDLLENVLHCLWMEHPWPLAECLRAVSNGVNPSALEAIIRSGRFGDLEDWVVEERKWEGDGLDVSEFSSLEPILQDEAGNGVLYRVPFRALNRLGQVRAASSPVLLDAFRAAPSGLVRSYLAELVVRTAGPRLPIGVATRGIGLLDLALREVCTKSQFLHPYFYEWLTSLNLDDGEWARICSDLPVGYLHNVVRYQRLNAATRHLLKGLEAKPDYEGLLVPLVAADAQTCGQVLNLVSMGESPSLVVASAKLVLRIRSGEPIDDIADEFTRISRNDVEVVDVISDQLLAREWSPAAACNELLKVFDMVEERMRFIVWGYMRRNFRRGPSGLRSIEVWNRLELPQHLLPLMTQG